MGSDGCARNRYFQTGWIPAMKVCDFCKSASALLFCKEESGFMCMACDAKFHDMNDFKHERVWICQVCEQAPAAVTGKPDAASLCVDCERYIHSANPLASRHDRVPAFTFSDSAEAVIMKESATAVSRDIKQIEFMFPATDQFLDFETYQFSSPPYSDRLVPVQTTFKPPQITDHQWPENKFFVDFKRSTFYSNNYNAFSLSPTLSSSSPEVGVVPDTCSPTEISYPFSRNMSTADLTGNNQTTPVIGITRQARVLRYREKKKNRNFDKMIRYASRKAYAETRPRIKGRFVKRTDVDSDIQPFFSSAGATDFISGAKFCVVPTL